MPQHTRRSLRARMITLVLIPSTTLLVVWALLTTVMLTDIRELRTTASATEEIGGPVVEVIGELQRERRATMAAASGADADLHDLAQARERTDGAVAVLDRRIADFDADRIPAPALRFQNAMARIDGHRASVDGLSPAEMTMKEAAGTYTDVIEHGLRVWDSLVALSDPEQVPHLRSLTSLMRTRELLNQQDAVLAHAVATNSFPAESHAAFAAAAGAQRYAWARVGTELSDQDRQDYVALESYSVLHTVYLLQGSIVGTPLRRSGTIPVNTPTWRGAAEAVDIRMREVEEAQMERVVALGHAHAASLRDQVLLISVPALVVALASSAVAVTGAQRVGRRLQLLRSATLEHARVRLPSVTARLRRGEEVDVDEEVPRLGRGRSDEIGGVAEAFDTAQRAAVAAAVEEAQVRAGVRNMFRNIARRTQSLVHRQLGLLDSLERGETDPAVLESLFRIDHFSTQLRRNAENLMLLSGDAPVRRGWAPVGLYEAVRAASSEIEDYTRVRLRRLPDVALRGDVGAGAVRLLAELLENATVFSPPGTEVTVTGERARDGGVVLRVRDRGLGMGETQVERANALLADAPRFDLGRVREDSQLGLFVVATVAAQHGLEVSLASSAQGTLAVVVIPEDALVPNEPAGPVCLPVAAPAPVPESSPALARTVVRPEARVPEPAGARPGGSSPGPAPSAPPVSPSSPVGGGGGVPERAGEPEAVAAAVVASGEAGGAAGGESEDTYMGLPRRRRGGRREPVSEPAAPSGREPDGQRSLSEIRSMMSAFQAGTMRGRAESEGPGGEAGARGAGPGEDVEG
ncbi:nitrate- and nitrite sensing domain-containing protein [Nocardiopsis sp. NRRL B-16309]|uniref:sensor histidine kinase n=1 Tax=Nocardiopsis sp. NRRL B-16309 TaxID=1519494 RepID=UPI0006AE95D2|nr:nitrate- and nitrite sensing domain-containing protein [Nocardiopsis sp. NRRL B-16309]KOX07947.1 histidine kinase [Nocardiopsis sp. NRRL B-16309]